MELIVILIALIAFLLIVNILFARHNSRLKRKVLQLGKELELKNSRLNYQKEQYSDSENYFSSTVVIIMQMMQELNSALKAEEGNLSEEALRIIFENAKNLFRPKNSAMFTVNLEKNTFSCLCSYGYKDEELRALGPALDINKSFLGWSAATGRFLSSQDAYQDSILSHLTNSDPLKCNYSQPLKIDNKVKAVLCLGPLLQQIEHDAAMQLFSILSNIASLTLSDAELTQELRDLSVRDSLTGLYNHSYFQKCLNISLDSLREKDDVLSIAMVDLDYFKRINDTYGHQAGDIILKAVSAMLNNLEVSDYICSRYGGEEFAIIFKGKDRKQALEIMEDARKRISEKVFEISQESVGITISAGIAEARSQDINTLRKAELISLSDQALYKAKAEGRNKVIVAG